MSAWLAAAQATAEVTTATPAFFHLLLSSAPRRHGSLLNSVLSGLQKCNASCADRNWRGVMLLCGSVHAAGDLGHEPVAAAAACYSLL
jgi:hypothetical protein